VAEGRMRGQQCHSYQRLPLTLTLSFRVRGMFCYHSRRLVLLKKPMLLAYAGDADISGCLRVAIVTCGAVSFVRIAAYAGAGITGSCSVALIQGSARYQVGAGTYPGLADIGLGAGIAIVAGRAVGFVRTAAYTGNRITGAGSVALILGRA